jgi:hypothetical protein
MLLTCMLLTRAPQGPTTPRMLITCGHTICEGCLGDLLARGAGSVDCPTCRKPCPVAAPDALPINYALLRQ